MVSLGNELVLCGLSDRSSLNDIKKAFRRFGYISKFILISENVESDQSVAILKYSTNESSQDALKHWNHEKLYLNDTLVNVRLASEFKSLLNPDLIPNLVDRRIPSKRQRSTSPEKPKHDHERHEKDPDNHLKIRSEHTKYKKSRSRSRSKNSHHAQNRYTDGDGIKNSNQKEETDRGPLKSRLSRDNKSRDNNQNKPPKQRNEHISRQRDQRYKKSISHKENNSRKNYRSENKFNESPRFEKRHNSDTKIKTEQSRSSLESEAITKKKTDNLLDHVKKERFDRSYESRPKLEPFKEITNSNKPNKQLVDEKNSSYKGALYSDTNQFKKGQQAKFHTPRPFNKENSNGYKKPRFGETIETTNEKEFFCLHQALLKLKYTLGIILTKHGLQKRRLGHLVKNMSSKTIHLL